LYARSADELLARCGMGGGDGAVDEESSESDGDGDEDGEVCEGAESSETDGDGDEDEPEPADPMDEDEGKGEDEEESAHTTDEDEGENEDEEEGDGEEERLAVQAENGGAAPGSVNGLYDTAWQALWSHHGEHDSRAFREALECLKQSFGVGAGGVFKDQQKAEQNAAAIEGRAATNNKPLSVALSKAEQNAAAIDGRAEQQEGDGRAEQQEGRADQQKAEQNTAATGEQDPNASTHHTDYVAYRRRNVFIIQRCVCTACVRSLLKAT
jgi:hypothetical protein